MYCGINFNEEVWLYLPLQLSERSVHMLDVVTLSQELMTKLRQETDLVMSDRLLTRDVLDARIKELAKRRDEEMARVDKWASQQKALINEVFSALIAENEADRKRNEEHLAHMNGEKVPHAQAASKSVRQLRAAE